MTQSLDSGGGVHFLEDQGIKDGEDVLAVSEDSLDGGMVPGVTKGEAFPALEHLRRDVDVPPELFERVAAQKKPVEKRRLVPGLGQARFHQCQGYVSVHAL